MKKTKYPLLTRLEVINKKKIILGFNGGDLYERKDNHSQFGWADKWEDIHNTLKVVYPLLVNLSNDQNRKKIVPIATIHVGILEAASFTCSSLLYGFESNLTKKRSIFCSHQ